MRTCQRVASWGSAAALCAQGRTPAPPRPAPTPPLGETPPRVPSLLSVHPLVAPPSELSLL